MKVPTFGLSVILLTLASAAYAGGLPLESPVLPERLPSLSYEGMTEYLASYREDWRDDTSHYADERTNYCRAASEEVLRTSIKATIAALPAVADLALIPHASPLTSSVGLQAPLLMRMKAFAKRQALTSSERVGLNRVLEVVAHDRGELYDQVIGTEWLLVRVIYRQYNQESARLAKLGSQVRSRFLGGNTNYCAALLLRAERNAVLSQVSRSIDQLLAQLASERRR